MNKWNSQQEKILKSWGEAAACYRYMNHRAYILYKNKSMNYTLPIIVISTITGTANFAQQTFPESIRYMVPVGIGAFNIVTAIMTTIMQFLKINELMEGHRAAAVHYGKLSRTIRLQLALPREQRSENGLEFVEKCRQEYDRLIEQSPIVPMNIVKQFEKDFPGETIYKPEIINIQPIETFSNLTDDELKNELTQELEHLRNEEVLMVSDS